MFLLCWHNKKMRTKRAKAEALRMKEMGLHSAEQVLPVPSARPPAVAEEAVVPTYEEAIRESVIAPSADLSTTPEPPATTNAKTNEPLKSPRRGSI